MNNEEVDLYEQWRASCRALRDLRAFKRTLITLQDNLGQQFAAVPPHMRMYTEQRELNARFGELRKSLADVCAAHRKGVPKHKRLCRQVEVELGRGTLYHWYHADFNQPTSQQRPGSQLRTVVLNTNTKPSGYA